MPTEPDQPGGSHDPTRANDPVDPTRANGPVDPTRVGEPVEPTRVQPGVDPTRAQDATFARPDRPAPVMDEPLRRHPDDDDDRKAAWWLWALLAAALIGIVLFALLAGDDDDDDVDTTDQTTETVAPETSVEDSAPEDTTADTAAPEDTTDATTEDTTATTAPAAGGGDAPAPDAGDDPGTVTAEDGTDLFTVVEGDEGDAERLAPYADQDVTGEGVYVLDVVDDEGFWIGANERQRIFAHAPDDVAVEVGQRIDFDGFLKTNPAEDSAEVHDIPEDQGAELHRQQGHHIELRSVSAA